MTASLTMTLMIAAGAIGESATPAAVDSAEPAAIVAPIAGEIRVAQAEVEAGPSAAVSSDAPASEASRSDWSVSFSPYLWAAGTKGDVGVPRFGQGIEIDKSFSDKLDILDLAFMGTLQVEHKRFIFISDLMFLDFTAKARDILGLTFLSGRANASILLASAAAGYRVVDKGPLFVDVFAGARVQSLDVKLKLFALQQAFSAGDSPTQVSSLLGARVRLPLGTNWALGLYGDVGGVIDDSAVKWQTLGTIHYHISRRWTAVAGYRYMSIDYRRPRLDFDVNLSGPLLGFTYRF